MLRPAKSAERREGEPGWRQDAFSAGLGILDRSDDMRVEHALLIGAGRDGGRGRVAIVVVDAFRKGEASGRRNLRHVSPWFRRRGDIR